MTVATDYVLGSLGVVLGVRLGRGASRGSSRGLWAAALVALAVAALAGGTAHGWADRLGSSGHWLVWRITFWSIGIGSLCLAAAAARFALPPRSARIAVAVFGLQFAVYAVWMLGHEDFDYVIMDYLPAMIFVLALAAWQWARGWAGGPWVVGGIAVSFLAAAVQLSGFTLHSHFNHNDLYHVIQMLGVYMLYRGGALLATAPG